MAHRLLLDTSSLFYRAFFALPVSIADAEGRPVNAVRGYLDMTANLIRDHAPDEVLHCLDDDWRPAPRVAAYDRYKSDRLPDPEGMAEQVPLLHRVLDLLGAVRVWAPGWEADDAIGTLAIAAPDGDRVDIITGDRDLLQLVRDPVVRVLFTVKGVKELALFDEAAVTQKYGVPPSRYVDFAILRGDPSDGLPGVAGVGEKTARDLVVAHGSLEAIRSGARDLSPKLAERVTAAGSYLDAMRQVVPVRADVPLERSAGTRDDAALDELAGQRRLTEPVRRLREALDA